MPVGLAEPRFAPNFRRDYNPANNNASLLQDCRGRFDVNFLDRESEVLRRPSSPVFLEHHHTGLTTRPQEQPPAAFVSEANFKA